MTVVADIILAGRLARRELRGGLRGFAVFVMCLMLGVASIAVAGSLNAALQRALREDSRALLGGDLDLRLSYRAPNVEETGFLQRFGDVSQSMEIRAMAHPPHVLERRTLVEVKAVDQRYPLYGALLLDPPETGVLEPRNGVWGAAVDQTLLDRLGLAVGDSITVGEATFTIRAIIQREPDKIAMALAFGPRLLISTGALASTGLIQPGSVVRYAIALRLAPGTNTAAVQRAVQERFAQEGWFIRTPAEATPVLKRFLDNLTDFLSLVGLTALLIGGIGIANGVKAFLNERLPTIAILKCLGTSRRVILATYFWQVAFLALLGIILGLVLGGCLVCHSAPSACQPFGNTCCRGNIWFSSGPGGRLRYLDHRGFRHLAVSARLPHSRY